METKNNPCAIARFNDANLYAQIVDTATVSKDYLRFYAELLDWSARLESSVKLDFGDDQLEAFDPEFNKKIVELGDILFKMMNAKVRMNLDATHDDLMNECLENLEVNRDADDDINPDTVEKYFIANYLSSEIEL